MRVEIAPYQFAAMRSPFQHTAFLGGIATGKTFTGCQFAIDMIQRHPDLTGFIGANDYNQMSQATLREFYYWLTAYGFEYVADRRPPASWGEPIKFKDYNNVMSVRNPQSGKVTYVFTRILSDDNPLRGMEFSWYWIDESRDTPQNTHEVILSRLRESNVVKGLVTSTTNGQDWVFERFVRGGNGPDMLYGSLHVPTVRSLELGIITQNFYDTLRASYSPMLALQELDAEHVNVLGGRAYYAAGERNKRRAAPWGDESPNPERPLVVGCDFNFSPAPCVWMIGQTGPGRWSQVIHWFGEIAEVEASTPQMTFALMARYPGFFYRVFGDASGQRGTTSNAGDVDYQQMGRIFTEHGAIYSIDVNQDNPLVKNRVENMNARFKNALGQIRMTYNPDTCPLFDGDVKMVGWKKLVTMTRQGRLDDGGDSQRTHATDGAGYAVYKLFPPMGLVPLVSGIVSVVRPDHQQN